MVIYLSALLLFLSPVQWLPVIPSILLGILGVFGLLRFRSIPDKTVYILILVNYLYWIASLILANGVEIVFTDPNFIRWQLRGFSGFLPLLAWATFDKTVSRGTTKYLTWSLIVPATLLALVGICVYVFGYKPKEFADIDLQLSPVRDVFGEKWFFGFHRSRVATGGFYLSVTVMTASLLFFWKTRPSILTLIYAAFFVNLWAMIYSRARVFVVAYFASIVVILLFSFILRKKLSLKKTSLATLYTVMSMALIFSTAPGFIERFTSLIESSSHKTASITSQKSDAQGNKTAPVTSQKTGAQENKEERHNIISRFNVSDRFIYWNAAIKMVLEHPLFGIGMGKFPEEFVKQGYTLNITPQNKQRMHVHNSYLHIATELGVFGISLFLGLWILIIMKLLKSLTFLQQNSFEFAFLTGVLAIIAGHAVAALADYNFWSPSQMFPVATLSGIALRLCGAASKPVIDKT